ncbi:putative transcription factor interactor and regulator CCHC(Zn) family [Helianthus debilis subsp. tardiflorus]
MISRKGKRSRTCSVCNEKGHDIRTCEILKGKQQGKQQKKMKGVQIEKDPRDKDNEVKDDEEEDEFEDYSGSSDDGFEEEDQWEEVSDEED